MHPVCQANDIAGLRGFEASTDGLRAGDFERVGSFVDDPGGDGDGGPPEDREGHGRGGPQDRPGERPGGADDRPGERP